MIAQKKPEVFYSEEYLLTQERQDGWRGIAADTHVLYEWFDGTPINISRPTDVRLVPATGGGADVGKVLTIGSGQLPTFVTPEEHAQADTSTASDTASLITVASDTIEGGLLGPHGTARCRILGGVTNASGSSRDFTASDAPTTLGTPVDFTVTNVNYPSGHSGALIFNFELVNIEDEYTNVVVAQLSLSKTDNEQIHAASVSETAVDTTEDWVFSVGLQMETADPDLSWEVYVVTFEITYAA